ncbi:hypothetical protein ABC382_19225 [Lysinibacillus sp. 1P01SD]|uniref:hypothetical protein n=1 Tax=Lysinibacillus sp. 1P01SD TaxID=3132285 RepID=UPI00399F3621
MEQAAAKVKSLVHENSCNAYNLSAQIIQLEVVQGAVARLIERLDDIVYKGWHKKPGMACVAIEELRDTVRLIDMGFNPLFKDMSEEVKTLNIHADKLYETVIKNEENKKADALTSTK